MKPYDPDSQCIKCGSMHATSQYEAPVVLLGSISAVEAIKRTCVKCGFVWHESTLESIEKQADITTGRE